MTKRTGVALWLALSIAIANADPLREQMHAYVRKYADAGLFSGVALVSKGDRVVYDEAFGFADQTFKVPNRIDTRFHIASLSKPFTAAAALILIEQGKLSLNDKLEKFVPDFPNANKITVEELLTHYSGLADASAEPDYNQWSHFSQTTTELVARAKKLKPQSEPGTQYFYSNSNYHLLAFIIEKVSGVKYGDFLAREIFKPAGMMNTAHRAHDETIVENLATGYAPVGSGEFERATSLDWTSKTGNGSLYSTVHDLLGFDRALRRAVFLKPETIRQSYGFDRKDRKTGMFWFHRERFGHRSVYVNGSSPGFKAYLERYLDDDATIVVLSNLYIAAPSVIGEDLGAILFGEPVTRNVPKPVTLTPADLKRYAGVFRFGNDYFTPNALVGVQISNEHLELFYPGTGFSIPLVPIEGGEFFDRLYWSFVRFDGDKLIYRNGDKDYVARNTEPH